MGWFINTQVQRGRVRGWSWKNSSGGTLEDLRQRDNGLVSKGGETGLYAGEDAWDHSPEKALIPRCSGPLLLFKECKL